jgi:hypothetical protein
VKHDRIHRHLPLERLRGDRLMMGAAGHERRNH